MDDAFISRALHEVRRGLAIAIVRANLDRDPETLPRGIARRVKARLKALAIILRRIIMLMALSLSLPPVRPRLRVPCGAGEAPVQTKSQAPWSFALSGGTLACLPEGPGFPDGAARAAGPVPAAPLQRRIAALARILRNPHRYAVRVARVLERRRRAAEPPPVCLPLAGSRRLHPELGVVAAGLPHMLAAAFERWNDSG